MEPKKFSKTEGLTHKTTNIQGLYRYSFIKLFYLKIVEINLGLYDYNHKNGQTYRNNVKKGTRDCESFLAPEYWLFLCAK